MYVLTQKPVFNDKFKIKKDEKSAKVTEKIKILEEAVLEEERQLQKSKEKLTQKSALYEKLSKSGAPSKFETVKDKVLLKLGRFFVSFKTKRTKMEIYCIWLISNKN